MVFSLDGLISLNTQITSIINQVSLSILILILGFIGGKLLSKLSLLLIQKLSIKQFKLFSIKISLEKIVPLIINYIVYVIAIVLALNYSGILDAVVYLILLLFCIVVIFSVFASLKELIPNWLVSIKLRRNPNFKLKRKIKINDVLGEISNISGSDIKITTEHGDEIHIPCKLFLKTQYKLLK